MCRVSYASVRGESEGRDGREDRTTGSHSRDSSSYSGPGHVTRERTEAETDTGKGDRGSETDSLTRTIVLNGYYPDVYIKKHQFGL